MLALNTMFLYFLDVLILESNDRYQWYQQRPLSSLQTYLFWSCLPGVTDQAHLWNHDQPEVAGL